MQVLEVTLFGSPQITLNGEIIRLPYRKAEALFYYLVCKEKVSRVELNSLLWPDSDVAVAQKNLRHALHTIRKECGTDIFSNDKRTIVELKKDILISSDVKELLSGNYDVYHGNFLEGFSVQNLELFDEWVNNERIALRSKYLQNLLVVMREAYYADDLEKAEQYGLRYLETDPIEEDVILMLMKIYSKQKKFRRAIEKYHTLCKILSEEYSISPLKETTELYYDIIDKWNNSTYRFEQQSNEKLVGKDFALKRILSLCNGAGGNQKASCCLITGKAGVGKTYLLDYVLKQYDFSDRIVCQATCYQTQMQKKLSTWNKVMLNLLPEIKTRHIRIPESYLKIASGLFPCLALEYQNNYNRDSLEFSLGVDYNIAQESALVIITMIAKMSPLILVFEDIHWMDEESINMLQQLLYRLQNLDIIIICTAREPLAGRIRDFVDVACCDKLIDVCSIYNLTKEETSEFVRFYSPVENYTYEEIEQIHRSTEGNALLLVQLLSSLKESDGSAHEIPSRLEDIIRSRVNSLSPDEKKILDTITVFPNWAPLDILTAILTKDPLETTYLCDQLCQKNLLSEVTKNGALGYELSHERIRTILVEKRSGTGSRILHLRIAQCLESRAKGCCTDDYDQIIYHYSLGGNKLKAFEFKVKSLDFYAQHCYELLPVLPQRTTLPQLNENVLGTYFTSLNEELSDLRTTHFGMNMQLLDEMEKTLLYTECRYCIHEGYYERAKPLLHRLIELGKDTKDDMILLKSHLQCIFYAIQTYDLKAFYENVEAGIQISERLKPCFEVGSLLRLKGLYYLTQGENAACREWMERSIAMFTSLDCENTGIYEINIAGAYNYIAESYRLEGDYNTAFYNYDKAIIHNQSCGFYPGAAIFYTDYGTAAFQTGRFEEAKSMFEYAEEIYESFHEYSQWPITLSYLAYFDVLDKNYDKAAERLRRAVDICMRLQSPWWTGITAYMMWKIRVIITEKELHVDELEALWPKSKREHCEWALSLLHRIEPRIETDEMEAALALLRD